ncbi:hypothetical protein M407DRAFT_30190 [Tulasnella calospora MUT 4182]|uniref:Anaphase-promoting complex subunit 5 domain-containing protein n=1 Tax=Tulasnella calospora MUT 4182 TaxID=1051891 RepID=A0A0C3Q7S2_9AGAM|nr:hypothetical protein M407DRAFT_30190 [Tulasnella calospora MUT 4182]
MHTEAAESYRLAQAIYLSLGYSRGEATVLEGLGGLYARLYLLAEAEECFAQARFLYAAILDEKCEAKALDGLMAAQSLQNKFGDAERACMEACEIYKRIGQPMSAVCANTLGFLQDVQGIPFKPL